MVGGVTDVVEQYAASRRGLSGWPVARQLRRTSQNGLLRSFVLSVVSVRKLPTRQNG
jgi:hypothetical protein